MSQDYLCVRPASLRGLRKSQRSTYRRLRFEWNHAQRLCDAKADREFNAKWPPRVAQPARYRLRGKTPVPEHRLMRWARWFEQRGNRNVGFDEIADVRVSTVFLGLDHGFLESTPVLFETMIFGGARDQEQYRWHTWDEARAGHVRIVEQLQHEGAP